MCPCPAAPAISIYGGTVNATGNSKGAGIGGGEYGNATVNIYSGTVTATGGSTGGAGIGSGVDGAGSDITISGGVVDVKVADSKAFGIGSGKKKKGASTITFSYSDATKAGIRITSESYSDQVDMKDDFIREDKSKVFPAAIYTDTTDMAGKTLIALIRPEVPYLGLDGTTKTALCIPLGPGTKKMKDDWYVVEGSISTGGEIVVSGNVNLILADGCTLDVKNIAVNQNDSLTIWAQSDGKENTGKLKAYPGEGYDQKFIAAIGATSGPTGTITINGGDIDARGGSASWSWGSAAIGGRDEDNSGAGTITMAVGETQALGAKIVLKPVNAVTTFTWTSSDPAIAAVDAYGNVTALAKGKATITVTAANGKKAKVKIKVK